MTNLLFFAGCILMFSLVTADTDLPHDQSVFLNRTATFTFCPPSSPTSYTINGSKSHLLPEYFKKHIKFTSNSSLCYFLSFPAWLEYDGAQIQFQWGSTGRSRTAVLHIQGVLGPPRNLTSMRTNSTHDSLVWDNPPSRLGHENTTYQVELSSRDLKVTEPVSVRVASYIYLRLAALAMASVTAWNPVGEGEMSTLNLSESLNGCKTIDDITPFALPYFDNGSIVVLLTWEINRTEVYCFDYITVMPTWRGPTRHIPTIEDNMAVIRLYNVPKESRHQVVVQLGTFQHNLSFSTYAVQNVQSTDHGDHVMLTCTFLKGVVTKTCFVVVIVNDVPSHNLSDSKSYTLDVTEGGSYLLMIYDHELQAERGVKPAKTIPFVIPVNEKNDKDKSSNELGIGIGVGVGLLFILFGVGIGVLVAVLVCKQCNRPTQGGDTPPVRCPEDNDGSAQYVCSQPTIPMDDEIVITSQPVVNGGNGFETGRTHRSPRRLSPSRVNAVYRKSDSDTGCIAIDPVVVVIPSRAEEGCDVATINRDEEDKAAQVSDDLKETNQCLHLKPVQPASS